MSAAGGSCDGACGPQQHRRQPCLVPGGSASTPKGEACPAMQAFLQKEMDQCLEICSKPFLVRCTSFTPQSAAYFRNKDITYLETSSLLHIHTYIHAYIHTHMHTFKGRGEVLDDWCASRCDHSMMQSSTWLLLCLILDTCHASRCDPSKMQLSTWLFLLLLFLISKVSRTSVEASHHDYKHNGNCPAAGYM